ncbi:helix-turn-helix transcriptional regulator [Nocardia abscessus]|uniref:helix-turn-helix transcriptional regulator n=1 Tax=Nocardia abscessus TaxID=120957 RepID=UPI002458B76C|nr:response regulator transcription factor [Nocardia abscessus]
MGMETILERLDTPATAADARDEATALAEEASTILRGLVPSAAYALCAWDPTTSSHVHRALAADGYPELTLAHINDAYVRDNPGFHLIHRLSRALRWRDMAREWDLDFSRTQTAEEFLAPSGFHEGTTICLRLRDGRYTGSLHMSWSRPGEATDDRRDTIERFQPILALVCDTLRAPQVLAEVLAPDVHAVVVSAHGTATTLPGRASGPELAEGTELRRVLAKSHGRHNRRRFLWRDPIGLCHRIEVIPCRGGLSLITEQTVPSPYCLTARELEILHLVASGLSNPEIGKRLYVSPRTVSTHVEHLLGKLSCASRAQLAAMAVNEGLLLGEQPGIA